MAWSDSCAKVNASRLAAFGCDCTYTPSPGGAPLPITAIRQRRTNQGVGGNPQWDEISLDPSTLPAYPTKGDQVVLDNGINYLVTAVRQPDPYGLTILTLNQAPAQPQQ